MGKDSGTFDPKNSLQKVIVDAFLLFTANGQNENDNTISVSDIGKVIRHVGCVPSEDELNEFIREVVDHDNDEDTVTLSDFVLYLEKQILALRYKPATEEELLQAFQTLDIQDKGSFSVDFIKRVLRKGESFNEDEIAEIIKTVYDPDHECILYNVWIHKLLGDTRTDPYALIPVYDGSAQRAADEDYLDELLPSSAGEREREKGREQTSR